MKAHNKNRWRWAKENKKGELKGSVKMWSVKSKYVNKNTNLRILLVILSAIIIAVQIDKRVNLNGINVMLRSFHKNAKKGKKNLLFKAICDVNAMRISSILLFSLKKLNCFCWCCQNTNRVELISNLKHSESPFHH